MPLPDLTELCIELSSGPGELCLTFPGGVQICAQAGYDIGDPGDITASLFAQLNSALAPMGMLFTVIDVVKGIFDCVKAIPDCLGPPPDPSKLANCLPDLAKKVSALLKLLPPFSIPVLVGGLIDVVITALTGLKIRITALLAKQLKISSSSLIAAKMGAGVQLKTAVDCATSNLSIELSNTNAGLQPLSRLLGIINLFLQLAGLPCIPPPPGLGVLSNALLKPIDDFIKVLQSIKAGLPTTDISSAPASAAPC